MSGARRGRWKPRRAWQRLRTVPGLGRDVLAVTAVAVVGVVAAVVIVGEQIGRMPWSGDRVVVRAEFSEAVAINPSKTQEVRVAGVPVGAIEHAEATERDTSVVSMSIDRHVTVYDNARAVLRPLNPLNEMYIDLDPGGPPGRPLTPAATIPLAQTERPTQLDEALAHLDQRARNALTNLLAQANVALGTAPEHLPAALGETTRMLDTARPVAEALQQRREKIQTLVTDLSRIVTAVGANDARLAELVSSTESVLQVLAADGGGPLRDSLRELPGVTTELRQAMAKTAGLTEELNPLLDNLSAASATLPDSLESLTEFVDEVDETLPVAARVVSDARPVLGDLRPVVADVHGSLLDLRPVTQRLDAGTARIVEQLEGISAFVYNTASLTVANDVNGTMVRGQLELNLLRPFAVEPEGCAPLPTYLPCLPGGVR